jgi:hypothetical protein
MLLILNSQYICNTSRIPVPALRSVLSASYRDRVGGNGGAAVWAASGIEVRLVNHFEASCS